MIKYIITSVLEHTTICERQLSKQFTVMPSRCFLPKQFRFEHVRPILSSSLISLAMSPKKQSSGYSKQSDEQTAQQETEEQAVQQTEQVDQQNPAVQDAEEDMLTQLLTLQLNISGSSNDDLSQIHARVLKKMDELTKMKNDIESEQGKRAKKVKDDLKKEENRLEKLKKDTALAEKKAGYIIVKVLLPDKKTYLSIKVSKNKTRGSIRRRAIKQAQSLGFFKKVVKGGKKKNPTDKTVKDVMLLDANNRIFT